MGHRCRPPPSSARQGCRSPLRRPCRPAGRARRALQAASGSPLLGAQGGGPAAQKNLCVQGVCSQCQAAGELRLPSSRVSPPRDPPQLGRPQTQARPAGEGGSCAAPGGRGRSQDHSLGRATVTKCGQTETREGRLSAGSPWAGHSRSAGQSHRAAPRAAILRWSAGWPHN